MNKLPLTIIIPRGSRQQGADWHKRTPLEPSPNDYNDKELQNIVLEVLPQYTIFLISQGYERALSQTCPGPADRPWPQSSQRNLGLPPCHLWSRNSRLWVSHPAKHNSTGLLTWSQLHARKLFGHRESISAFIVFNCKLQQISWKYSSWEIGSYASPLDELALYLPK